MPIPRRIVLTGAGRGLGRAMTTKFAELGHTVCACSQSPDRIAELSFQFGPPHQFNTVDVTDDAKVARWAKSVLKDGPPDLLLNNAAVCNKTAALWKVPQDEFAWVIDVNIKGTYHFQPRRGTLAVAASGPAPRHHVRDRRADAGPGAGTAQ